MRTKAFSHLQSCWGTVLSLFTVVLLVLTAGACETTDSTLHTLWTPLCTELSLQRLARPWMTPSLLLPTVLMDVTTQMWTWVVTSLILPVDTELDFRYFTR